MVDHIQIPAVDPIIEYTVGATSTSDFVVPFPFFDNDDLVVTVSGVVLDYLTHYTVTGAGQTAGGTVTLLTPVTSTTVIIERDIEIKRVTDFPATGPFDIDGANTEWDRQIAIMQDLAQRMTDARAELAAAVALLGGVTDTTSTTTQFSSRASAALASISALTDFVRTAGYSTAGDGGGAVYIHATGSTTGGFQSLDGQWWKLESGPVVNPKMFGAPWNGVGDDAAGIQAAIDWLQTNFSGGRVDLPPGLGILAGVVNVSDRIEIAGTGAGTNIRLTHATAHGFNLAGGACIVRDFKFTTLIRRSAGACIRVPGTGSGATIDHILTESGTPIAQVPSFYNIVHATATAPLTVQNCNFSNPSNAGILIDGAADFVTIESTNVQWQGALGSGGQAGIWFQGAVDGRIWNCQILGMAIGIFLDASATSVLFNDFFNCTVDHNQIGCVLSTNAHGVVQTRFTNVQFTSSSFEGCKLTNAGGGTVNGVSFVNCTFQYNGGDGLSLPDSSTINMRVAGGEFSQNAGSGISIAANTLHFLIQNARIGNIGGALGNGVYGINIAAGCDSFIVTGNDLTTSTGAALNNAAGTSATKVVTNNIS